MTPRGWRELTTNTEATGPVDALFNAIRKLSRRQCQAERYEVKAVTEAQTRG